MFSELAPLQLGVLRRHYSLVVEPFSCSASAPCDEEEGEGDSSAGKGGGGGSAGGDRKGVDDGFPAAAAAGAGGAKASPHNGVRPPVRRCRLNTSV